MPKANAHPNKKTTRTIAESSLITLNIADIYVILEPSSHRIFHSHSLQSTGEAR